MPSPFSTGFSTYPKTRSLVNAAVVLALPYLLRIASLALGASESTRMFSFI